MPPRPRPEARPPPQAAGRGGDGPAAWPCLEPDGPAGCRLNLAVVPQARRAGADGLHDGALRVRLTAPPVDGKANDALLAWLAGELGLARRELRLLRGVSARRKQVALDRPAAEVAAWLDRVVGSATGG